MRHRCGEVLLTIEDERARQNTPRDDGGDDESVVSRQKRPSVTIAAAAGRSSSNNKQRFEAEQKNNTTGADEHEKNAMKNKKSMQIGWMENDEELCYASGWSGPSGPIRND